MATNSNKTVNVENPVKLPISFKEFSKEPVKGLMFLCILAVGYLYVDIKMTNSQDKKEQRTEIKELRTKLDDLAEHVRVSDSAKSALGAKNELLQQMNEKIK